MEPAQLTAAVVSIVNTSRIILQYVQNLQKQVRRRRQRNHDSNEDMDTDFSQSTGTGNLDIMVVTGQVPAVEHRSWARETKTDWWDHRVLQVWDDSQWLRNFHMRKGTFMEHCDLLSPALKRKNTKMKAALTAEKQVGIALWKLATPDSYQSVGNQFGVGKSIVGAAVIQVANAITELLLSRVVTLRNVQVIVDGFAAMGFPNYGRAIDEMHIPILGPDHLGSQYVNCNCTFQWCCKHWWITRNVSPTSMWDGRKRCMMLASSGTLVCLNSCRKELTSQTGKLLLGMLKCL
nr:uncharacterized protein LOC125639748 [Caretta caretta]